MIFVLIVLAIRIALEWLDRRKDKSAGQRSAGSIVHPAEYNLRSTE